MTQHLFRSTHEGRSISVLLGWDRPIGHYFMVIEWDAGHSSTSSLANSLDCPADDDTTLYSNLDEPNAFELSLDYFKAKLTELGIWVPVQMFEQVEIDRANRAGNRHVIYQADGSFHQT